MENSRIETAMFGTGLVLLETPWTLFDVLLVK
jgi:hypothetical protein